MKKIFIDVTQLMQWQGRLTGVPRVQHELVSRFARDSAAIFVTWHGYDFCEIESKDIFKDRTNQVALVATPKRASDYIKVQLQRGKRLASRSNILNRVYHRIIGTQKSVISVSGNIVVPDADDSFLIVEGIWSDENYIQKIINFAKDNTKIIQISYDMLPVVTPQFSGHSTDWLDNYVRKIYPICTLVLSISEYTKQDITKWLTTQKLRVPNIEVFRLGDDFKLSTPAKPVNKAISSGKFILCVGTIEARKNHTLLYYAYKQAVTLSIQVPQLVIVGRKGWRAENIFDLMTTDPDIKDHITILENTSDEELSWLYSNCLFTVYPSFYEGWGLPIAESMYYGIPCLASNTSSMPEVAGDLISYFDPTSPDTLLKEMTQLLKPNNLKEAQLKVKKYKMTSWDNAYDQVKQYIMEAL